MKTRVLMLAVVAVALALIGGLPGAAQENGERDSLPGGQIENRGGEDDQPRGFSAPEPLDVDVQNFPSQCITYVSSDVPVPTLFYTTAVSTITVPDDFTVTDVDVGPLTITHGWVSDLNLFLESPQGTSLELHTPAFSGGNSYVNTVFSDEAILPITAGLAPFGGTFRPEGSLSDIDLESAQGVWDLRVENTSNTAGNIYAWSLRLCGFFGQTVVAPGALESAEGNADNGYPFNLGALGRPAMRYQQVYGAVDLPGRGRITQIAFRPDASVIDSFKEYYIEAEIRLAHTDAAPDGLSTTFDANLDRDVTLVYDGPLYLSSSAAGGTPQDFDIVIGTNATFTYNGVDNLLMEVKVFNSPDTAQFDVHNAADSISRIWAFSTADAVAIGSDSRGLVTQFMMDADTDGDGCTNAQEFGADPLQGGQRNPKSFWDFYDVPTGAGLTRDGDVASEDIFGVIGRFNATDVGPGDFDQNDDPLSTPNPVDVSGTQAAHRQNYHPAYDRTSPAPGGDPWDASGPDGAISAQDIFAVLSQFGHSCW